MPTAIELLYGLRFTRNVQCLGRRHLHAVGQFERVDASRQVGLRRTRLSVLLVQLPNQVELRTLLHVALSSDAGEVVDGPS